MVGAVRAGEDLAKQIIITSELFYNTKTKLRFLIAIKEIICSEIEQLEIEDSEEETRDPVTGEILYG